MPRKPLSPCKHPLCPNLTEGYFCDEHKDEMQYKQEQSKHKKLYNNSRWQSLRQYRLNTEPLCRQCYKEDRIVPATVVDHIRAHKGNEELFYDINNLQSLCKPCHDRKTAKEDGRWKRRVYTY